jgi:hypothetical protein
MFTPEKNMLYKNSLSPFLYIIAITSQLIAKVLNKLYRQEKAPPWVILSRAKNLKRYALFSFVILSGSYSLSS